MKRLGLTPLLVLAAITTALLVGAKSLAVFPGDLELARLIQGAVPAGDWARAVTRAAYVPWIYGVLAVSAVAALRVAGWRGAAAMLVTFFALMYIEQDMKGFIARPRPPALMTGGMPMGVHLGMSQQPSYGMPSGWALLFGASVGLLAVLAWRGARGVVRWAYVTGCAIVLVAGLLARVAMGQHWPSDVIAGYLLAITLGLAVFETLATLKGKGQRGKGKGDARLKTKG